VVLLVPALFATGILGIDWSTGRPRFKFNREAAKEVREEVAEKTEAFRDEWQQSSTADSESADSESGLQLTPQGIFGQRDEAPASGPTVLPRFLPKLPATDPSPQRGPVSFDANSEPRADKEGPLARIRDTLSDRR
jgi:hypothetical protein